MNRFDSKSNYEAKVPYWEKRFNVEIYDMARLLLYLPPKYGDEGNKAPDPTDTPVDFVPKHLMLRDNSL